jgi:hypothetical protein
MFEKSETVTCGKLSVLANFEKQHSGSNYENKPNVFGKNKKYHK